jgi:hypothetical protein
MQHRVPERHKVTISPRSATIGDYARAFVSRRQNWTVFGRNLIPVVGVYTFDWSVALTAFNYWFDGITAMGAMLAALLARALIEIRRMAPTAGLVRMVVGGALVWVILFGLCSIPYWLLLNSAQGVLQPAAILDQITQSPALWFTFGALALSQFWRAFDGGYLSIPIDQLKQRGGTDFFALLARVVAMSIVFAQAGLRTMLVPLMALALTYIEVGPEVRATALSRIKMQNA